MSKENKVEARKLIEEELKVIDKMLEHINVLIEALCEYETKK